MLLPPFQSMRNAMFLRIAKSFKIGYTNLENEIDSEVAYEDA